ncbi:vesicle coat component [Clavispora lusitaniae]|nr:vesicle coat component [Clavispora lusitaniae]
MTLSAGFSVGYSSKDVSEKAEDEENKMPSMRPQGSRKVEERKEQNKSYAPPPPANVDVSFEEGPGPVYEAPAWAAEMDLSSVEQGI